MAITQTGATLAFPVTSSSFSGTVSSAITVPADAELAVVGVSGYLGGVGVFQTMTFSKGGADAAMVKVGGGESNNTQWQGEMFTLALPDTGSGKSLKWTWSHNAADDHLLFGVTFWKGVNTASPVRDSDGNQHASYPSSTKTLTALSGDKIVAFCDGYSGTSNGSFTSWSNLTEIAELARYAYAHGAFAAGDPSGNTTVGIASVTNISQGALFAVVLKPAAGAAGKPVKVWTGSAWVTKPVKVWSGSAWVAKPAKVWNGSAWV